MTFLQDRFEGVWAAPYLAKLAFQLAMVFVIFAALTLFSTGLFGINLVSTLCGTGMCSSLLYMLMGISALWVMFDRNTYLPFLGEMVAPCSILQNKEPPGATKEVKIVITPNTKVMYWAAEHQEEKLNRIQSWKDAYAHYDNAGVTTSNGEGVAILKVREPQAYKVPFAGKLESHIHYRVCGDNGFIGAVRTVYVNQSGVEGFESQHHEKRHKAMNLADSAASIY
jgi:uncharacterized membrane protein YuzA (DUF378 family)